MAEEAGVSFAFTTSGNKPYDKRTDVIEFQKTISKGLADHSPKSSGPKTSDELYHLLSQLPAAAKCVLYFSGYGLCDDGGNVYVQLTEKRDSRVFIRDILRCLLSEPKRFKTCQLFFELCVHDDTNWIPRLVTLPTCKDCVIAISGLVHEKRSRKAFKGGIWTRNLIETYEKMAGKNVPISTVLNLTMLKGKPTRISSDIYPLYTASPAHVGTPSQGTGKDQTHATTTASVTQKTTGTVATASVSQKATGTARVSQKTPEAVPTARVSQERSVLSETKKESSASPSPVSLDATPTKEMLKEVLSILEYASVEVWKDRFGKRLMSRLKLNDLRLATTTRVSFLVDLVYEKGNPTWSDVINALEEPTKLKVRVEGREVIVANEVKRFLGQ